MNSEQFQNLLQSIENSDLLFAIPYNIDVIGFGEINVNHICGEVYSVFSSEDPTVLIIIAYLLGSDLRMIVTCRFNTTAELKENYFHLADKRLLRSRRHQLLCNFRTTTVAFFTNLRTTIERLVRTLRHQLLNHLRDPIDKGYIAKTN